MRRRIYKILGVCMVASMLFSQTILVHADAQDGELDVGGSGTMISDGNNSNNTNVDSSTDNNTSSGTSDSSTTGSINNSSGDSSSNGSANGSSGSSNGSDSGNTTSNSGTSGASNSAYNPSVTQVSAQKAQKAVGKMLQNYIDQIKNSDSYYTLGLSTALGDLNTLGVIQVPDTDISQMLNHIQTFEKYIQQEQGLDNLLNNYNEISITEHPQKNLTATSSDWDTLSTEERANVKKAIADQEGLPWENNGMVGVVLNKEGTDGNHAFIKFNGDSMPLFTTHNVLSGLASFKGTDYTGVRSDLILSGFNDFNTWSGRFHGLERLTSNAMEDYCVIGYIQDYHISTVEKDKIEVIDYTSDLRRWQVIDLSTGETVKTLETNNPEHELTLQFNTPGKYQVVAEQEARYTQGTYVQYDICDYLFDVETQNLLYFNEKTISNGSGKSVYVGGEEQTGWVRTGDVFNWTINDLGQVETDGSATERVE